MELSQIRYFIQTAQLQNMSKAARTLNISQPTLSKSIANLEKELGTELFDREGRKLVLNDRGKRFLTGALMGIETLENAADSAREHRARNTIHLGLFHISDSFLQCVGEFSAVNPEIVFNIDYLNDENIDTNEFDLLLYPRNSQFKRYKGEVLYTDRYCLAVSRENPLAHKDEIVLDDISGEDLIVLRQNGSDLSRAQYLLRSMGENNRDKIYTNSSLVQMQMISAGYGVGLVPAASSKIYEKDGGTALLPVADLDLSMEIMVGFKREKHLSESGKRFAEFLLKYFESDRQ